MRKILFFVLLLGVSFAFMPSNAAPTTTDDEPVLKWYTWEEAIALNETNPKKLMVDVYTDWCGWCKVMDKQTFTDPKVAEYLAKNFYPVKFNAEQKEEIIYNEHTFKFVNSGRRGVHELAYSLLDGRLGYPSIVYLDETQQRITVSPGFKKPNDMIKELKYVGEEVYKTTSWDKYAKSE